MIQGMEEIMNRRSILKSISSTLIGAGLLPAGDKRIWAQQNTKAAPAKIPRMPFIDTRDRTNLLYKDWGEGKPIVFVHSWALNSDMWQYQMNYLVGEGLCCVAYDRRGHGRSSQPGYGYD
jgi:non-heme chloroperoxidase